MTTIYQENGYKNRRDYLECLADDYGVEFDVIEALISVYPASEDFDGLVSALEDYSEAL